MSKEQAIRMLYNLLKPVQKEMFESFFKSNQRKYVVHSSRRLGKTYLLVILSLIFAINKSNAQVRYASVSQKAVRKMIFPIFNQIIPYLPKQYKPVWNSLEGAYRLPNGSQIHIAGVNAGKADSLRGTSADLALIDEAAFCDELSYLTESVLMPQLLTVAGSRLIMASSSPLSPAHEFAEYIQKARLENAYSSYDIHSGGYDADVVAEFCKEAGGANSTTWRREYLNELITDSELSIIPEWKKDFVQVVAPDEYRHYYHNYEAMDIGVRDMTAVLFAYYDFRQAKLIVEDEFTISGINTTTKNIAKHIDDKEHELGYDKVYRRPADNNNLILLQDLSTDFNKHFFGTTKEELAAMVNEVRLWVGAGRVLVNPKCEQLLGCLEFGVYHDTKRKEFGRSKVYGHFDALAALVYLIRNIDQHTNPVSPTHGYTVNTFDPKQHEVNAELKKIFNL
jgi:hypothetical protein